MDEEIEAQGLPAPEWQTWGFAPRTPESRAWALKYHPGSRK